MLLILNKTLSRQVVNNQSNHLRVSLGISEYLLLIYVALIPIEDFFLKDLVSSSTRYVGGMLVLLYLFEKKLRLRWRLFPSAFYLFFGLLALSIIFWADRPDYYVIVRLFFWMMTTVVVADLSYKNPGILPRLFMVFSLTSVYLSIQVIITFLQSRDLSRATYMEMDQNGLAAILNTAIVFLFFINITRYKRDIVRKNITKAVSIVLALGVVSTGSRGGLITMILAFLVYTASITQKIRIILIATVLSVFFVFNYLDSDNKFFNLLDHRVEESFQDKAGGRLPIWTIALQSFLDKPVFGHGYRNFRYEFRNYIGAAELDSDSESKLYSRRTLGTHNTYLEVLTEVGLLGLILFVGFQIRLLRRLGKLNINQLPKRLVLALFAVLFSCSFFICGYF